MILENVSPQSFRNKAEFVVFQLVICDVNSSECWGGIKNIFINISDLIIIQVCIFKFAL